MSLFATACPISSTIAFIYNLLELRWAPSVLTKNFSRPVQNMATNIGPWLGVWEFLTIASVVTNSLLLYIAHEDTKALLGESDERDLWIILAIEHLIIGLKFFTKVLILDHPVWVKKSYAKMLHENEELKRKHEEIVETERNKELGYKIEKLRSDYHEIIDGMLLRYENAKKESKKKH